MKRKNGRIDQIEERLCKLKDEASENLHSGIKLRIKRNEETLQH
jgi:hypothetical protein